MYIHAHRSRPETRDNSTVNTSDATGLGGPAAVSTICAALKCAPFARACIYYLRECVGGYSPRASLLCSRGYAPHIHVCGLCKRVCAACVCVCKGARAQVVCRLSVRQREKGVWKVTTSRRGKVINAGGTRVAGQPVLQSQRAVRRGRPFQRCWFACGFVTHCRSEHAHLRASYKATIEHQHPTQ